MQDHFGAVANINLIKRTQDLLTRLRGNTPDRWKIVRNNLRELPANSLDAFNSEVAKLREQLLRGLAPAKAHLRRVQDALLRLGGTAVGSGRKLCIVLWELPANSLDAFNGKVVNLRERLRNHLEPVKAHFLRVQGAFTRLGRRADKSRKLRTRKNDLRKLLANSPEAVVVTSSDRRFVAANPKGLGLFGISETNMTMFTLDVFLSGGQIPRFVENGTSFMNRKERQGECEIRRLDGSLRVAEYVFVANYVPFLHVFRFQNDRRQARRKRLAA